MNEKTGAKRISPKVELFYLMAKCALLVLVAGMKAIQKFYIDFFLFCH